jgi:hypothetical protein
MLVAQRAAIALAATVFGFLWPLSAASRIQLLGQISEYRLPPHNQHTCRSKKVHSSTREYIEKNYPYFHAIKGSRDLWSGKELPPTKSQIYMATLNEYLKWSKTCELFCPSLKPVKPLGSGWLYAGQYGTSLCNDDRWLKLLSRAAGRIEVETAYTGRLQENSEFPEHTSIYQIRCLSREYWRKSFWAPIASRTIVDKAAKLFC